MAWYGKDARVYHRWLNSMHTNATVAGQSSSNTVHMQSLVKLLDSERGAALQLSW